MSKWVSRKDLDSCPWCPDKYPLVYVHNMVTVQFVGGQLENVSTPYADIRCPCARVKLSCPEEKIEEVWNWK
jgi:hypothetical protein